MEISGPLEDRGSSWLLISGCLSFPATWEVRCPSASHLVIFFPWCPVKPPGCASLWLGKCWCFCEDVQRRIQLHLFHEILILHTNGVYFNYLGGFSLIFGVQYLGFFYFSFRKIFLVTKIIFGYLNDCLSKIWFWSTEISHFPNHFPKQKILWCRQDWWKILKRRMMMLFCVFLNAQHIPSPWLAAFHCFQGLWGGGWGFLGRVGFIVCFLFALVFLFVFLFFCGFVLLLFVLLVFCFLSKLAFVLLGISSFGFYIKVNPFQRELKICLYYQKNQQMQSLRAE